jgi:hypothetical protein
MAKNSRGSRTYARVFTTELSSTASQSPLRGLRAMLSSSRGSRT